MPTPVSDFTYHLPEELIAQYAANPRDSSRLLIMNKITGERREGVFRDIVQVLKKGDVLVFNTTKVFRARLMAEDNKSEVFILKIHHERAEVLIKPGKKYPLQSVLRVHGKTFTICEKNADGVAKIETGMSAEEMFDFCEKFGEIPVPPYVKKENIVDTQYQTVYAKEAGSVAAPTAGLHFTPRLLEEIRAMGVQIEEVVLHVGIGTFRPVQGEYIEDHVMHAETVELRSEVANRLKIAKKEGRRIIAVGTTTTRVLEGVASTQGDLVGFAGELNIFITPGYTFKVIDGLITNFHLPKSTLLMLVSAFAGRESILEAYRYAVEKKFRFFSFGDAMAILT